MKSYGLWMAMISQAVGNKEDIIPWESFLETTKNKYWGLFRQYIYSFRLLKNCKHLLKPPHSSFFCRTEVRPGPS